MNQYETVFILTPVLSDDQMKEAVDKYRAFLEKGGAEILYEENWGMRKLAYTIDTSSATSRLRWTNTLPLMRQSASRIEIISKKTNSHGRSEERNQISYPAFSRR